MCNDSLAGIERLPLNALSRVESFMDEAHYYGWKLKSVEAKQIGDILLCTLDFDRTRIMFFVRQDEAAMASALSEPRRLPWLLEQPKSRHDSAKHRTTRAHHSRPAQPGCAGKWHPLGA